MTDPPFLTFWASLLLPSQSWHLWSMDLFPDAFVSNGLVSSKNYFYLIVEKIVYSFNGRPKSVISLGPIQLRYIQEKYRNKFNDNSFIIPCGVNENKTIKEIPE